MSATREFHPLQDRGVFSTKVDTAELNRVTDFSPSTPVTEGVRRFVEWYRSYHA